MIRFRLGYTKYTALYTARDNYFEIKSEHQFLCPVHFENLELVGCCYPEFFPFYLSIPIVYGKIIKSLFN